MMPGVPAVAGLAAAGSEAWTATAPAMGWVEALPGILLAAAFLWLPGALVARLAGARGLVTAAVAPVLTLGILAVLVLVQVLASSLLGVGLWTGSIVLGTLLLAALVALVTRQLVGWRAVPDRTPDARPRERRLDALPAALGCLVSGVTFALATGRAGTPEQSNDSPFHLSAIARVADRGDGSWQVVRGTTGHSGFYPPLFDDVAALLVRITHLDVVSAANTLLLLVVALVWPLGVDALVRTILTAGGGSSPRWHPERVGRAAAMALVPATAVFPAQLLQFGALWPNLLGIALLPVVIAALVDLTYPRGRTGERASLWTPALDWTVLGLGSLALGLAHPSALLSFGVLAGALVAAGLWRWGRASLQAGRRGRVLLLAGVALGGAVLVAALVGRSAALSSVTSFVADQPWTLPEALARAAGGDLVLGIRRPAAGVLALVGVVSCLVRRRHRWLVVGWALAVTQVVLAGAVDSPVTALLTGAWYHETARLSAASAVATLALAAIGAVSIAVWLSRIHVRGVRWAVSALLAVACAGWVAVGIRDVHAVTRDTYQDVSLDRSLVTAPEAQLYARALRPTPGSDVEVVLPEPGEVDRAGVPGTAPGVVGDPFGGAMFAALYSGRPTPIRHFGQALTGPAGSEAAAAGVVARSLRTYAADAEVCAAVRRLGIGYAVEDTRPVWTNDPRAASFAGLRGLGGAAGFELVEREGTVSVYRLTSCLSTSSR